MIDDEEDWKALPETIEIYRAESHPDHPEFGLAWTLDLEVAEGFATEHDLTISRGLVNKGSVLAYITHYGESEIVIRREHLRPG